MIREVVPDEGLCHPHISILGAVQRCNEDSKIQPTIEPTRPGLQDPRGSTLQLEHLQFDYEGREEV